MNQIFQSIRVRLLELNQTAVAKALLPSLEPGATEFVLANPYAFCLAACLDRGARAEIIWTIPYWLRKQLGHLDPQKMNRLTIEEWSQLVAQLPKRPRFVNDAPRTLDKITKIIVEEFNGNPSKIWENKKAAEVKKTFRRVHGVGPGISNMIVLLLEKAYGIRFSDLDHATMDIKPDVHTMRVLYRLGVAKAQQESDAIQAARLLNPNYPGEIDGPLWLIGRNWCTATHPNCTQCIMNAECLKKDG